MSPDKGRNLAPLAFGHRGEPVKASGCFTLVLSHGFFTMSTDTHQIIDNQPVKNTVKAPPLLDVITIKKNASFRITKAPDPVQAVKVGRLGWGRWIGILNGLPPRLVIMA